MLGNPGALVMKEHLLDALWPGAHVTDNALAQAVSELRHALGGDAGTPLAVTRPIEAAHRSQSGSGHRRQVP
jgi:DNA-binding winged helix-turn-helix (wHTH) protein